MDKPSLTGPDFFEQVFKDIATGPLNNVVDNKYYPFALFQDFLDIIDVVSIREHPNVFPMSTHFKSAAKSICKIHIEIQPGDTNNTKLLKVSQQFQTCSFYGLMTFWQYEDKSDYFFEDARDAVMFRLVVGE